MDKHVMSNEILTIERLQQAYETGRRTGLELGERLIDAANEGIDNWTALADDCANNAEDEAESDYRDRIRDAEQVLTKLRNALRETA